MTLSEEELDEGEHYAVRAHIHRRRLRERPPERHLDEEDPPGEEAPGGFSIICADWFVSWVGMRGGPGRGGGAGWVCDAAVLVAL